MPSTAKQVEILLKATDQFSDTTKKANLQFAAMKLQADQLSATFQKLSAQHPDLSADEARAAADALQKASGAAKGAGHGFTTARIAAQGLGQEIGLALPRAVTTFLARSQTIGPLLTAAFSTVAIVGMVEVLSRIPAEFDKLRGAITGWDDDAKKAYDDFIKSNIEAGNRAEELQEKINASAAGRTEGSVAKSSAEYDAIVKNIALATERSKELLKTEQQQQFAIDDLNTITHNVGQYIPFIRLYWTQAEEAVAGYKKTLPDIIKSADEYKNKLQEMNALLKEQAAHQLEVAQNARLLATRSESDRSAAQLRSLNSAGQTLGGQASLLQDRLANVGLEGLDQQDEFRRAQQLSKEAEDRRNADRLAELAAQRRTASLDIDPEKRADAQKRIDDEEAAEAELHQNNLLEINNKATESEIAARQRFYDTLRSMQLENAEFDDKQTEQHARDQYELTVSSIRDVQAVQDAQLKAHQAADKGSGSLFGIGSLEGQQRDIQAAFQVNADALQKQIDAVKQLMQAYEDLGEHEKAVALQPELGSLQSQLTIAGIDRDAELRKASQDFAKSFQDEVGHLWDSFFLKGKGVLQDLADLGKSLLRDTTKRLVESLATSAVFGPRIPASPGGLIAPEVHAVAPVLSAGIPNQTAKTLESSDKSFQANLKLADKFDEALNQNLAVPAVRKESNKPVSLKQPTVGSFTEFDQAFSAAQEQATKAVDQQTAMLQENVRSLDAFDKAVNQGLKDELQRDQESGVPSGLGVGTATDTNKELGDAFDRAVAVGLEAEQRSQVEQPVNGVGSAVSKAIQVGLGDQNKALNSVVGTAVNSTGLPSNVGALGGLLAKIGLRSTNGGPWSEAIPGLSGGNNNGGLFGGLIGLLGGAGGPATEEGVFGSMTGEVFDGGLVGAELPSAGAAASSGGIGGLLGLGGGAGLLGLGAATIPIVGAGITILATILSSIFSHHNAPFTEDPNAVQKTREYDFYSSVQDLKQASKDISNFVSAFNTVPPGVVVKNGMPAAINSSPQFAKTMARAVTGEN